MCLQLHLDKPHWITSDCSYSNREQSLACLFGRTWTEVERLKWSPLSCVVHCIKIANQCLKGCLNLGLTSFPSPVCIRAYIRSDKAFCLVNSNTFYAFFNREEKAAMCFDSCIIGPPSLFTYVSKYACFSIIATRLQKLSDLWHPLNITDCIQPKLDGQDTASRQKSEFTFRHLSNSFPANSFSKLCSL